jgi:hypothetical protein
MTTTSTKTNNSNSSYQDLLGFFNKSHMIPPQNEGEGLVRVRVSTRGEGENVVLGGPKY